WPPGMTSDSASPPALFASLDSLSTPGLEFAMSSVTGVGDATASDTVTFVCSPLPTRALPIEMVGALTETDCDAPAKGMVPGAVADTVVVPTPSGSKATPPAATVVGALL